MSEVAGRKVIKAGAVELTVKELCVSEIRALLSSAEAVNEDDALGDFLLPDLRLCDLMAFTTLTKDQVEQMLPSHLEEVLAECKAMNRHFFEMGARLAKRQAMP